MKTIGLAMALMISCKAVDSGQGKDNKGASKKGPFRGSCDEIHDDNVGGTSVSGHTCDEYYGGEADKIEAVCKAKAAAYGSNGKNKVTYSTNVCGIGGSSCEFVFAAIPGSPTVVRYGDINGSNACPGGSTKSSPSSGTKDSAVGKNCSELPRQKSACIKSYITDHPNKGIFDGVVEAESFSVDTTIKTSKDFCVVLLYQHPSKSVGKRLDVVIEGVWSRIGGQTSIYQEAKLHENEMEFHASIDGAKGIEEFKEVNIKDNEVGTFNFFPVGDIRSYGDYITGTASILNVRLDPSKKVELKAALNSKKFGSLNFCATFSGDFSKRSAQ